MKRLLAAAAGLALVGCTTLPPQMIDPTEQAKDPSTVKTVAYPSGPFGYTVGSIIENLTLTGQSDDNNSGVIDTTDTVKTISLSDYYADKKNKVLFIGAA